MEPATHLVSWRLSKLIDGSQYAVDIAQFDGHAAGQAVKVVFQTLSGSKLLVII